MPTSVLPKSPLTLAPHMDKISPHTASPPAGIIGRFLVRIAVAIVLACCLSSAPLRAQAISTSQIKGTVLDPSGSVVPGAEVTVTQTDKSFSRTVATGVDG